MARHQLVLKGPLREGTAQLLRVKNLQTLKPEILENLETSIIFCNKKREGQLKTQNPKISECSQVSF